MTFAHISEVCFLKLKILMIAVDLHPNNPGFAEDIVINAGNQTKLTSGCLGFFLADSAKEVKRAAVYCIKCHEFILDLDLIRPCDCTKNKSPACVKLTQLIERTKISQNNGFTVRAKFLVRLWNLVMFGDFQNSFRPKN